MKEAIRTSETSINFYQTTRRNIREDSDLHSRCRYYNKQEQRGTALPPLRCVDYEANESTCDTEEKIKFINQNASFTCSKVSDGTSTSVRVLLVCSSQLFPLAG
jgi:hypothetical protein